MAKNMDDNMNDIIGQEDNAFKKMIESAKKKPIVPIGATLMALICGHGFLNLRKRQVKLSLFLINYRLYAQGAFIACATVGLVYLMVDEYILGGTAMKRNHGKKPIED